VAQGRGQLTQPSMPSVRRDQVPAVWAPGPGLELPAAVPGRRVGDGQPWRMRAAGAREQW
jgi:hypothetical protein